MSRVLFALNSLYLPRDRGGANISLHALCKRLAARGVAPIVVCHAEGPPSETAPTQEAPYIVLREADPHETLDGTIARFDPAAVVIRAPAPAASVARFVAMRGRTLHMYFQSGFIHRSYPTPRQAPHFRYLANSPFLVRMAEAALAATVPLVPSLIEPADYRVERTGDAVLFVNPVAIKGVHLAAAIAEHLPQRRFLFAPSWPDTVAHPHVQVRLPNVEWLAPSDDMRPLYARTRVLLVPSVSEESSARVIGEAQISGIPAVVSDRGGLRESVGSGGLVLSLDHPIANWCATIESLFTDAARFAALSRGALAHTERPDYLPDAVVARFLEVIGV